VRTCSRSELCVTTKSVCVRSAVNWLTVDIICTSLWRPSHRLTFHRVLVETGMVGLACAGWFLARLYSEAQSN
jgi:hypothetical protein